MVHNMRNDMLVPARYGNGKRDCREYGLDGGLWVSRSGEAHAAVQWRSVRPSIPFKPS